MPSLSRSAFTGAIGPLLLPSKTSTHSCGIWTRSLLASSTSGPLKTLWPRCVLPLTALPLSFRIPSHLPPRALHLLHTMRHSSCRTRLGLPPWVLHPPLSFAPPLAMWLALRWPSRIFGALRSSSGRRRLRRRSGSTLTSLRGTVTSSLISFKLVSGSCPRLPRSQSFWLLVFLRSLRSITPSCSFKVCGGDVFAFVPRSTLLMPSLLAFYRLRGWRPCLALRLCG